MQNKIILLLFITLLSTHLFAGDYRIGVKIGPAFAHNLNFEDGGEDNDFHAGLVTGAYIELGHPDKFVFQPELLFHQKGSIGQLTGSIYKCNYLETPFLFKWNYAPVEARVRGNFYVGPYVAILLSAYDDDIQIDNYHRLDAGIAVGGGIGVKVGPGRIVLDLRETLGLTPIFDTEVYPYLVNSSFTIMIGYSYDFGDLQRSKLAE